MPKRGESLVAWVQIPFADAGCMANRLGHIKVGWRVYGRTPNLNTYRSVGLFVNGNKKYFLVHRIIAITFISNPENKPCVNHKDRMKGNNAEANLEWATIEENNLHWQLLDKAALSRLKLGGAVVANGSCVVGVIMEPPGRLICVGYGTFYRYFKFNQLEPVENRFNMIPYNL